MNFPERVNEYRDRLTRSDRVLLDEILAHPAEAPFWRGGDVAQRAGVHAAAATRLAQRLGYQGYLELRDDLRRDREDRLNGAGDRFREELRGQDRVLEALLATELDSLAAVLRHVDQAQVDEVADLLAGARTVYLFARGNAGVLADLLDGRLRRFGMRAVNLSGPGREVAERLLAMSESDVVVSFAFRRAPRNLTDLYAHAASVGARTVLVTDTLHTLDPGPTTVLSAPRGHQEGFSSLSVPMMIANAIVLTVAQRHPDAVLPALDRLDGLLADFD
ncbi:MurR/RpiR family transcriptional regulator [Nocardiopsis flavescens]|uniref:DNA-binding transcriptional regulator, MurR/RpiR family, contains HTH and SIS domains n=1 Tax=Nocardiopsis flavescens TaxID=758803 RepID=A0A1M6LEA3_9ACTN|nr:MurR/RpiR family transcriptional regulator [Nocardiopsis flavescens]SHJ69506.1 DNA-binding transcriptional regulator, MurR/RpiR family, contains HTH and SIS domains [Nocardiopsis flavescens]